MTGKSRENRPGIACELARIGVAILMLALVATAQATIASAATPTATRKATPTPTRKPTATPTRKPTPTPTPSPLALWLENAHSENVLEFKGAILTKPGASVPSPNLANKSPDFRAPLGGDTAGITFDGSNNQWVTDCVGSASNHGNITEFKLSTLKKLTTNNAPRADVLITDNGTGKLVNCPWGMTFNSGNLWAANSDQNTNPPVPGFVTEYQPNQLIVSGHPTPHVTLTDSTQFISPTGVVFDSSRNLFVADFGPEQFGKFGAGKILVFRAATVASLTPGTNNRTANARLSDPTTLTPVNGAFDRSGNLWVPDCEANGTGELYMFPKSVLTLGASTARTIFQSSFITTPNGTEDTINCPGGIAFDAQGNLWYTNFQSLNSHISGSVGEFTRSQLSVIGKTKPKPNIFFDGNTTATNFDGPIGLIFGPVI